MKAFWFDTETTGLDDKLCAIHQLACVVVVGGTVHKKEWKIRPHDGALFQPGWDVSGVTKEEVMAYEITHDRFHHELLQFLAQFVKKFDKKDKLWLCGYNTRFDENFLRALFTRNNDTYFGSWFWYPCIDVAQLAALKLLGERHTLPNFQLGTVYQHVMQRELEDAHDAFADVLATRELFRSLYSNIVI